MSVFFNGIKVDTIDFNTEALSEMFFNGISVFSPFFQWEEGPVESSGLLNNIFGVALRGVGRGLQLGMFWESEGVQVADTVWSDDVYSWTSDGDIIDNLNGGPPMIFSTITQSNGDVTCVAMRIFKQFPGVYFLEVGTDDDVGILLPNEYPVIPEGQWSDPLAYYTDDNGFAQTPWTFETDIVSGGFSSIVGVTLEGDGQNRLRIQTGGANSPYPKSPWISISAPPPP